MFRSALQHGKFENKSSLIIVFIILIGLMIYDINALAQDDDEDRFFGWFEVQNPPDEVFRDVIVDIDNSTWVVSESGAIYISADLTKGYQFQFQGEESLDAIEYEQGLYVAVGENGYVLTKTNESTWLRSTSFPDTTANLLDIDIRYPNIWITGESAAIYYSGDAGQTWSTQTSPIDGILNSVSFLNDKVGWIVGDNGLLLSTTDAGITWGSGNSGVSVNLNDILITVGVLTARMWIAADDGLVLASSGTNLGLEFTELESSTTQDLYDITSPIDGVAYIAGANQTVVGLRGPYEGEIQKLNDTTFSQSSTSDFFGIAFVDADKGIAVGDLMYYTTTGGGLIPIFEIEDDWQNLEFYTREAVPRLLTGMIAALQVVVVALSIGFVLGLTMATFRTGRIRPLQILATFYSDFFRNTPLLVQLSFIAFGLPAILNEFGSAWKPTLFARAVMALALNTGAYQSEIIRSGILAIPTGQMEAARSLGMTNLQAMRHIILPQAIRITIPPLSNESVNIFLNSSLLSVIGYREITREGNILTIQSFLWARTFIYVACTYFIITYTMTRTLRRIERNLRIPGLGAGHL